MATWRTNARSFEMVSQRRGSIEQLGRKHGGNRSARGAKGGGCMYVWIDKIGWIDKIDRYKRTDRRGRGANSIGLVAAEGAHRDTATMAA